MNCTLEYLEKISKISVVEGKWKAFSHPIVFLIVVLYERLETFLSIALPKTDDKVKGKRKTIFYQQTLHKRIDAIFFLIFKRNILKKSRAAKLETFLINDRCQIS